MCPPGKCVVIAENVIEANAENTIFIVCIIGFKCRDRIRKLNRIQLFKRDCRASSENKEMQVKVWKREFGNTTAMLRFTEALKVVFILFIFNSTILSRFLSCASWGRDWNSSNGIVMIIMEEQHNTSAPEAFKTKVMAFRSVLWFLACDMLLVCGCLISVFLHLCCICTKEADRQRNGCSKMELKTCQTDFLCSSQWQLYKAWSVADFAAPAPVDVKPQQWLILPNTSVKLSSSTRNSTFSQHYDGCEGWSLPGIVLKAHFSGAAWLTLPTICYVMRGNVAF